MKTLTTQEVRGMADLVDAYKTMQVPEGQELISTASAQVGASIYARDFALPIAEERDALAVKVRRFEEREAHWSVVLGVTDGGQYRADWDVRIRALVAERDALRVEVAQLRATAKEQSEQAMCALENAAGAEGRISGIAAAVGLALGAKAEDVVAQVGKTQEELTYFKAQCVAFAAEVTRLRQAFLAKSVKLLAAEQQAFMPRSTCEEAARVADEEGERCRKIARDSCGAEAARNALMLRARAEACELVAEKIRALPAPVNAALDVLDAIRRDGWTVAVHNDYKLNDKPHTFWLLTKGERAVKGEGETDAQALGQIAQRLAEEANHG